MQILSAGGGGGVARVFWGETLEKKHKVSVCV